MLRPLSALTAVAFLLVGCGGGDTPATADTPEASGGTPAATTSSGGVSTGPAPAGSAGSFALRFAESDEVNALATEAAGFFAAPVPADALEMTALDGVPSYHIGVDKTTIPDDFELKGTYFVFVQAPADRAAKVSLLRGHVGLSNNFQTPFVGQGAAFAFPPLWPADGPAPTLTLDHMGDQDGQIASMPLAVMSERPAWAQPVDVPAGMGEEDYTVTAELELAGEDMAPYLLYREKGDENRWGLADFRRSSSEVRRREKEGDTRATTPYSVYPEDMSADNPEAYLVVFAM